MRHHAVTSTSSPGTRRLLGVLLTVLLISTLTPAVRAEAITSTISLSIVSSGCTSATWKGAVSNRYTQGYWPAYKVTQNHGTVRYCATKLRANDENPDADYYLLESAATWTRSHASAFHTGAPWQTTVQSNRSAIQREYSATPTFSRSTCDVSFSVGFRLAGFSLASPQRLRCGTSIRREHVSVTGTRWSGVDASRIATTSLVYAQAVKEGAKPTYSVTHVRPTYAYSWSKVRQCRGSCWYGWKPRATQTSSTTTQSR